MTEIEAQKFIARWTPRFHRCEATQMKIRRIGSQFWAYFFIGAMVLYLSLSHLPGSGVFGGFFNILGMIFGIGLLGFASWMMRRLRQVRRILDLSQS
jgi:hypothetical protein